MPDTVAFRRATRYNTAMEELYQRMTQTLLSAVRQRGEDKKLLGGALPSVCSGCSADVDYCARRAGVSPGKARFYVAAHYAAYVPFGAAGWNYFVNSLEKTGASAGEHRAWTAEALLRSSGEILTADGLAELKTFLGLLYCKTPDFGTGEGCAAAVCTLYHACEAHFGKKGCSDFLEVAHRTSDATEKLFRGFASDVGTAYAETLLSIAPSSALSARQKKLLFKITGVK